MIQQHYSIKAMFRIKTSTISLKEMECMKREFLKKYEGLNLQNCKALPEEERISVMMRMQNDCKVMVSDGLLYVSLKETLAVSHPFSDPSVGIDYEFEDAYHDKDDILADFIIIFNGIDIKNKFEPLETTITYDTEEDLYKRYLEETYDEDEEEELEKLIDDFNEGEVEH